MEVLEKGTPIPEKPQKIKCSGCNSMLAYLKSDIKYGEEARDSPYVTCPVCKTDISTYATIKE